MVLESTQKPRRRSAAARRVGRLTAIIATAALIAFPLSASASVVPNPRPTTVAPAADTSCGVRPLDVVIVIDKSGSMGSTTTASGTPPKVRLVYAQQAANDLVTSLNLAGGVGGSGLHHVGLTSYGGTTAGNDVVLGTSSASTIHTAINGLTSNGNTPFKTGMATGAANMTGHDRATVDGLDVTHVIIFLSDGRPNPDPGQRPSAGEISTFRAAADQVFSVAIGVGGTGANNPDLTLMASLAKPADASHTYHVTTGADIPNIFKLIYDEIACKPGIAVAKTASTTNLPFGGGSVTYTYKVTNPGQVALSNVTLGDDKCSSVTGPSGDTNSDKNLDVSETWTYTCTMDVTTTTKNVATATGKYGNTTVTASDNVTVTVAPPKPGIAVAKSASKTDLPFGGGAVTYTYLVTNTGQGALSSVTVVDDKCSAPTYVTGDTNSDNKLDTTETWTFTCTMTLADTTTNVATATGHAGDATVTAKDNATVTVAAPRVGIDVAKSADMTALPFGGGPVTYTYLVTNTGQVALSSVTVVDDKCYAPSYVSGDTNSDKMLDLTETWTFTCTMTLADTTTNVATATGHAGDATVTAQDNATVTVAAPRVGIDVAKSADKADLPATGGPVSYTYLVTNTGQVALSSVTVVDDKCDAPSYVSGDTNSDKMLDLTETWTFTCTMTLADTTTNVATATGHYGDAMVTAQDNVTVTVAAAAPAIDVAKSADTTSLPIGGGPVIYTYLVTNTGNVPLSNVTLGDDKCSSVTGPTGDTNDNQMLDLTETWTFTCTMDVTATTKNVATATGHYGDAAVSAQDNVTVTVAVPPLTPAIAVDKSADKTDLPATGGSVIYTYLVTNTGNVPLSNVTLGDDKCSAPAYVSGDTNSDKMLDTTETWSYTCTMDVTATTKNVATATGQYEDAKVEATDNVTVTVAAAAPAIDVAKSADTTSLPIGGGPVIYTYLVTNTGNVPLSNVTLGDDKCSSVTGPTGDTNDNQMLDLTETWTFTCTMDVTATTKNVATATGHYGDAAVSAQDNVTVTVAEPTAKPTPSGTVAAETGTPDITLPPTDATPGGSNGSTGSGSLPLILGLLAVIALAATIRPASLRNRSRR